MPVPVPASQTASASAPGFLLVAPPTANPWTGGYLYNAQCAAHAPALSLAFAEADELSEIVEQAAPARCLLDSIYLASPSPVVDRVAAEHAPLWMLHCLPHYLVHPDERERVRECSARRLAHARGAITSSGFLAERVRAFVGPGLAVEIVRPGLAPIPRPAQAGTHVARDPVRVLSVANLAPHKGVLELARALAAARDLAWRWDIVGDAAVAPEHTRAIEALLGDAGVADRVRFRGLVAREQLGAHYAEADLFALLARDEAYGMVFAEAQSFGLPVLALREGGPCEIVEHAGTGLLCAPDDPDDAARALRALLGDQGMRSRLSENARQLRFPGWPETAAAFTAACARLSQSA
ncbi:glycosyl transferase group 1 [Haliangium ochraceum DSM 14365]|uniref:Glycosyl transferase group 1 n=1 Tax=Haliangium ochraceum (strain DSM 14365 / JCM 11303 / SMP-2) TaxID=502025 RepID=D0LLG3_HALO1|nr:glycosyl transferase group 1 [Haliangium ochraceum DSM 14365]